MFSSLIKHVKNILLGLWSETSFPIFDSVNLCCSMAWHQNYRKESERHKFGINFFSKFCSLVVLTLLTTFFPSKNLTPALNELSQSFQKHLCPRGKNSVSQSQVLLVIFNRCIPHTSYFNRVSFTILYTLPLKGSRFLWKGRRFLWILITFPLGLEISCLLFHS